MVASMGKYILYVYALLMAILHIFFYKKQLKGHYDFSSVFIDPTTEAGIWAILWKRLIFPQL